MLPERPPRVPVVFRLAPAVACLVVACNGDGGVGPPPEGAIQVTATTTGNALEADGYTAHAGNQSRALGVNASTVFGDLAPGGYDVELSGVHFNCAVAGDNPRSLTVTAGQTTQTTFEIACGHPSPRIAFMSERDGNQEIYVMNDDGTGVVRLTNHPDEDADPAWSPDGQKIAFTREGATNGRSTS